MGFCRFLSLLWMETPAVSLLLREAVWLCNDCSSEESRLPHGLVRGHQSFKSVLQIIDHGEGR